MYLKDYHNYGVYNKRIREWLMPFINITPILCICDVALKRSQVVFYISVVCILSLSVSLLIPGQLCPGLLYFSGAHLFVMLIEG